MCLRQRWGNASTAVVIILALLSLAGAFCAAAGPWVPPEPMDRLSRYLLLPLRVHVLQSEQISDLHSRLTDADVTRILGKVNQVWAQAGVQFYLESLRREPAADASLRTGREDRPLEDSLLQVRPPGTRAPGMFHVYYVHRLRLNGTAPELDGIFVKDTPGLVPIEGGIDDPIARVTAHELGHGLMLGHQQEPTSLMASGTTGVVLTGAEIARARSTATLLGWALAPEAALQAAERVPHEPRLGLLRCLAGLPVGPFRIRDTAAARLVREEQERP